MLESILYGKHINKKGDSHMEWIQSMNAAVNYMEEHILEDPDLNELGKLAGCSAHHFQRIFTYGGGITLTEYIRKRRMSLAAVDLKDENVKVIDVATKYGYDSPTAFNRAFQMIVRGAQEMNYRIEKRENIRVVGKKIPLKATLEENFQITPRFWQESAMDGTIEKLAALMDTEIYGLMGISVCNEKDEWEYYIAVASTKEVDDFEELIVPETTWAVFCEEGPVIKMQELETKIITEWLPTSGYEYANAPEIELYLNPNPAQTKYEIWLPIVRKGGTL